MKDKGMWVIVGLVVLLVASLFGNLFQSTEHWRYNQTEHKAIVMQNAEPIIAEISKIPNVQYWNLKWSSWNNRYDLTLSAKEVSFNFRDRRYDELFLDLKRVSFPNDR